jgi:hydroxymethylglutaryl-CoA synthase
MKIGIDAISYYVPKTYLPIESLAIARGIEYAKLNKGLGLERMAIPDLNEDVATMATNAVLRLIAQNNINPTAIGRIYLGTESALDAAKSTASYVAGIVEQAVESQCGKRALKNCDVVDMTFACIGAIDALENALDWVRAEPSRIAIVVAADLAKYDLASAGEYTQGAGAVAVLVTANPRMLAINQNIGVAMHSVSDFFKPRRTFNKVELLASAAQLIGQELQEEDVNQLLASANHPFWGMPSNEVEVHKEEPVFDGPYSNDCYQERITEALSNFKSKEPITILERWNKLVFHLPYAFQGRRMIVENWMAWMKDAGRGEELKETLKQLGAHDLDTTAQAKALAKSALFQTFVQEYIAQGEAASSQIGNMYTASIFMSLLSLLVKAAEVDEDLAGKNIGFFAYGSGSKSKVLEAEVQVEWKQALHGTKLFEELNARHALTFQQYEAWHNKKLKTAFVNDEKPRLSHIGEEGVTQGYRYYA